MPRRKKTQRRRKVNPTLAALFKLSQEELQLRKTTGGGIHKTRRDAPRSEQNRQAINEQRENY